MMLGLVSQIFFYFCLEQVLSVYDSCFRQHDENVFPVHRKSLFTSLLEWFETGVLAAKVILLGAIAHIAVQFI